MKRVKKNQYNNKYTRKDGRNENMVVGFNIIAYTAMILLAYSVYFILFVVVPSGKLG